MRKSQTAVFLLLLFIWEILYFVRKHIWKNLDYIVTYALPFFHVARYWKYSNTNAHIDIHWFCRRHTLIQDTWQLIRYFKKTKKKLYDLFLWMGSNCLKARATQRRQFTFYHYVPRNSWYLFYQHWNYERLSRPWSHPAVLNKGLLD